MDYKSVVNDLHFYKILRREAYLGLILVHKWWIKFENEDSTQEWICVKHDYFIV